MFEDRISLHYCQHSYEVQWTLAVVVTLLLGLEQSLCQVPTFAWVALYKEWKHLLWAFSSHLDCRFEKFKHHFILWTQLGLATEVCSAISTSWYQALVQEGLNPIVESQRDHQMLANLLQHAYYLAWRVLTCLSSTWWAVLHLKCWCCLFNPQHYLILKWAFHLGVKIIHLDERVLLGTVESSIVRLVLFDYHWLVLDWAEIASWNWCEVSLWLLRWATECTTTRQLSRIFTETKIRFLVWLRFFGIQSMEGNLLQIKANWRTFKLQSYFALHILEHLKVHSNVCFAQVLNVICQTLVETDNHLLQSFVFNWA